MAGAGVLTLVLADTQSKVFMGMSLTIARKLHTLDMGYLKFYRGGLVDALTLGLIMSETNLYGMIVHN